MQSEYLLELEDLTFSYPGHLLLNGVQMRVQAGEMIAVLGPNGSGKSTLLRLLSGVLRPQRGRILLEGQPLVEWRRRSLARRVAVVPQELQLSFAFTVEQMVGLGRTPFINLFGIRTRRDQQIVAEAMRQAQVDLMAGRLFAELSGGERQRVMLAMALAQQPHLLLLDELTSHLDIKYQIHLLELIGRLNRETGVTVIAAMHDLNLAARYFPRLLLFQRGIVADGGPAEVLDYRLLHHVYGTTVQVGILRGTEHLSVLPPGETAWQKREEPAPPRVHLMAGGGSGELVMRALADAHIPFSAGVFSLGDSDAALARSLANDIIIEQPFAPLSPSTSQRLRACLQTVSLLIVCAMPLGQGNLALLHAALEVCQSGRTVLLLLPMPLQGTVPEQISLQQLLPMFPIPEIDYTHGEGQSLLQRLIELGAIVVSRVSEVLQYAHKIVMAQL